jgi:ATP-dependent exoDNAse (exonuclease V) beta subunit
VFVHECFREVRSIEDLVDASARAAIVGRARRRAAAEKREPVSDKLADEVGVMLARIASDRGRLGTIAQALDLEAVGDTVRVHNELAFTREVNGALVNGRIDRLVLSLREGVPIGATIIDFKTGAKDSPRAVLEAKIAGYRSQLSAYGDAVAEMFTIPREGVSLELLFVDRGEVVVLGSP